MQKFAVLYTFPEIAFKMAIERLARLRTENPEVTFFPLVGMKQLFHIPMIIDKYLFGPKKIPGKSIFHEANWLALSAPGVFQFSNAINKKIVTVVQKNVVASMCDKIKLMGLPPLFVDCTPLGYENLDHSVMEWFDRYRSKFDFDYLIYYESDMFATKPLDLVYGKYMKLYDACFVNYELADSNWHFFNFPLGCKRAMKRWLRERLLPPRLYRSLFAGALISRRCLEKLRKMRIDFSGEPYGQCELRLPTLVTALGFRVGRLDFPYVRFRPEWSWDEIVANKDAGIFHPVKRSFRQR